MLFHRLKKGVGKSKIESKQKLKKTTSDELENLKGSKGPKKPKKPAISFPISWPTIPDKTIDQWDENDWRKLCKSPDKYLPSNQPGLEGKIAKALRCFIELITLYLFKFGK